MTDGNERIGVAALTIHKDRLVSLGCGYIKQVTHRDLRIAEANSASSLGIAYGNVNLDRRARRPT